MQLARSGGWSKQATTLFGSEVILVSDQNSSGISFFLEELKVPPDLTEKTRNFRDKVRLSAVRAESGKKPCLTL